MPKKGPKCRLCSKSIPVMDYNATYVKFVTPGSAKNAFICMDCAKSVLGDKLDEITAEEVVE